MGADLVENYFEPYAMGRLDSAAVMVLRSGGSFAIVRTRDAVGS